MRPAELELFPCFSDKSKRRTKTVKKSAEPKWNQTFIYSHVHRRDFRERMLEITVWDQPRVQEEESEFLGEVGNTVNPSIGNVSVLVIYFLFTLNVRQT